MSWTVCIMAGREPSAVTTTCGILRPSALRKHSHRYCVASWTRQRKSRLRICRRTHGCGWSIVALTDATPSCGLNSRKLNGLVIRTGSSDLSYWQQRLVDGILEVLRYTSQRHRRKWCPSHRCLVVPTSLVVDSSEARLGLKAKAGCQMQPLDCGFSVWRLSSDMPLAARGQWDVILGNRTKGLT